MSVVYPTLIGEMAKRSIKKIDIAKQLHISERTLYNKLSGIASFAWEETCAIQETFFPDLDKNDLFRKSTDSTQDSG